MRKIMAYLMVVVLVVMAFSAMSITVSAEYVGDVTILADGTVNPADAPIHVKKMKYSLTDDILGSITIQKSGITLCGEGYTLEGTGGGVGILAIGLTDITIKDFKVRNFYNGIVLVNSDTSTVKENDVSGCVDAGIYLTGSSGNTVKDNKAHDNVWEGIWLEGSSDNIIKENEVWNNCDGIFLWYSSNNNIIKENKAWDNYYLPQYGGVGIYVGYSSNNNIICKNDVSDENNIGITIWEANDNTVSENKAFHNLRGGIYVYFGTGNIISKNTIKKNYFSGHDAIRVWFCGGNTVSQNTISDYYRGFLVVRNPAGSGNVITENTVRNSYKGIQLSFNSYDNQIHHNNFINNDIQVIDHGIDNLWDDGSEGNYWSDYKGKDKDKDGIGDTPYMTDGAAGSMDNYPLMKPWK